jgi:hypothetical protein
MEQCENQRQQLADLYRTNDGLDVISSLCHRVVGYLGRYEYRVTLFIRQP